jgi:hypothetical protein
METYFCADNSRSLKEDIIGSAPNNQTYVLIECPTPWAENAFNSRCVPLSLKTLKEKIQREKMPVNLLLINEHHSSKQTKSIIIFKRKQGLSKSYSRLELEVQSLEEVASLVESYLHETDLEDAYSESSSIRDILVCTHGSHDKCCAKYGIPFYREALETIRNLQLTDVRIWQSSHFGGHRFAPTAIDFPEGRYYGVLNQNTFCSLLTRTGDINCIRGIYRGWGILSIYAQILERELLLLHGWEWFKFSVESNIISQNEDKTFNRIELTYKSPSNILRSCIADVVKDQNKSLYLKGSCNGKESERVKLFAENLVFNE